jgi:sec-independent protein translocase protein TatB
VPGFQEWIIIAVVALLVVGPDRLPQLARQAGELLARVRAEGKRGVTELTRMAEVRELQDELDGLRSELRGAKQDLRRNLTDGARAGQRPARPGSAASASQVTPFDPEAT